jgi:hypothetical protein
MKLSIMPRSGELKEENRKKLAYVLPEYSFFFLFFPCLDGGLIYVY